jgi:hypothetical protein
LAGVQLSENSRLSKQSLEQLYQPPDDNNRHNSNAPGSRFQKEKRFCRNGNNKNQDYAPALMLCEVRGKSASNAFKRQLALTFMVEDIIRIGVIMWEVFYRQF